MTIAIAACDRRYGIGKNNTIPFNSDLQFFKEETIGHPVIMGRQTWNSLPKRPLVDRINIVVSTKYDEGRWYLEKGADPFYCVKSIHSALNLAAKLSDAEPIIIGGAKLYGTAILQDLVDRLILTRYAETYDCDVIFPFHTAELEKRFPHWRHITPSTAMGEFIRIDYRK